jgi:hypothetical protein
MPPGTRLNNVWLDVSVLQTSGVAINVATLYGLSGFVVNMDDPDSPVNYDHLWDSMIAKDQTESYDILSIDTASATTSPEFDVGKLDLFQILGTNLVGNMQIYQRRQLLTFPKRPIAYDPSNDTYFPQDAFKVHITNGPTVKSPSVAMFGFSSPGLAGGQAITSDQISATPSESQWLYTMYAEVFLYDMWKHLIGVTPGSSTDPYDTVSAWFAQLLEDQLFTEDQSDAFSAVDYKVWTKATWDITVIGKPGKAVLTSD